MILVLSLVATSMAAPRALTVLCYHHVDYARANPYNISSQQLKAHLSALKRSGFTFVTMASVRRYYQQGSVLPSGSVLVTFDDGNHDAFTLAWPILKAMRVPMTVFIYPTAICVGHKRGFMDWDDVITLSRAGVEIGAHGFDHPYLPYPPKSVITDEQVNAWLKRETLGAKNYIEQRISHDVTTMAFPFGLISPRSAEAIKKAGYQLAFNISGKNNSRLTNPLFLNRIMVVNTDTADDVLRKSRKDQ